MKAKSDLEKLDGVKFTYNGLEFIIDYCGNGYARCYTTENNGFLGSNLPFEFICEIFECKGGYETGIIVKDNYGNDMCNGEGKNSDWEKSVELAFKDIETDLKKVLKETKRQLKQYTKLSELLR
jgi:hypothetical protein